MKRNQRRILGILFFVLTIAAFAIVFASRAEIAESLQIEYDPANFLRLTLVPTTEPRPNTVPTTVPFAPTIAGGSVPTSVPAPTLSSGVPTTDSGATGTGSTTIQTPPITAILNFVPDPNAGPLSSCDPVLYPALNDADRDYFDRANGNAVDATSYTAKINVEASFNNGGQQGILTISGNAIVNSSSSLPRMQLDSTWQMTLDGINLGNFNMNVRFIDNILYSQINFPGVEGQWTGIAMGDLSRSVMGQFADMENITDMGLFDTGDDTGIGSIVPYTDFPQYNLTTLKPTTGITQVYDSCVDILGILTDPEFVRLLNESLKANGATDPSGPPVDQSYVSSGLRNIIKAISITTQHNISTTEAVVENVSFNATVTFPGSTLGMPNDITLAFRGIVGLGDFGTAPTVDIPPNATIVDNPSAILGNVPAPSLQFGTSP